MAIHASIGGLLMACGAAAGQNTVYTAPDSVQVVQFLEDSVVEISDQNGDCLISDVDIVFLINQRLIDQYGETLEVGDLDGDTAPSTGMDVVVAIKLILAQAFGDADHDGSVTQMDVGIVGQWVGNSQIEGDINLDGQIDMLDANAANSQVGEEVGLNELSTHAFRVFDAIGQLRDEGPAAFTATACAPEDHLLGVSSTWPADHPSWWPSNHVTGVSRLYVPDDGEEHHTVLSKSWPANHLYEASQTWPMPGEHHGLFSGTFPPPHHEQDVSAQWPAAHMAAASDTWDEYADHDTHVSRTWWPNHERGNSRERVIPPPHMDYVSRYWVHDTTLSTKTWPPGHSHRVSDGWGPIHQAQFSATYPPNHVSYASWSWRAPYSWPPSHTQTISESWGDPSPGDWPVFPPDHDWLTTFSDMRDLVDPPSPWPDPWP